MRDIGIVQYNCGNANGKKGRPLFDELDPDYHKFVVVQEPMVNQLGRTYCPVNYTLAIEPTPGSRVCFMVSNKVDQGLWKRRTYGPCVASLTVAKYNHYY